MLGKIAFETAQRHHDAWLNEDLTWGCDDPALTTLLNEISDSFGPEVHLSDDAVRHLLYRVAYRLGGRVMFEDRDALAH